VLHFLGCIESFKHQAILTTCYAGGLRISEATRLKPEAIDRQRMVLRVEQGKGQKDRYVMLSARLLEVLTDYWRAVRPTGAWMFPGAVDERCLQPDLVGADRIVPAASVAASRDLDASSSTQRAAT
jgi:integrase/recombinase XerD